MACCILGAIIMSQIIAIWRARRRILFYAAGLALTMALFVWQIDQHWMHIQQFAWDVQAIARGEDPAAAALTQPALICKARPNIFSERNVADALAINQHIAVPAKL